MIRGEVNQYVQQWGVLPAHKDLFEREATLPELIERLKKYPVIEWLSFLARIQSMLRADNMTDVERMQRVLCGTCSPEVQEKLKEFESRLPQGARPALYYERQLSTLQQLAVLHAEDSGTATLDSADGHHDLSMALLITIDLMMAGHPAPSEARLPLPNLIQDQIRTSMTPAIEYAARAVYLFELNRDEPSDDVSTYFGLFKDATGVSAVDCILGGLVNVILEGNRTFEEIANGRHAAPRSDRFDTPQATEIVAAYDAVRMKPLSELRDMIKHHEEDRPIRDWNLIAISRAPVCDFGDRGRFVINHTVLGRSLFDSLRHEILTAALRNGLEEPYTNEKAIGQLYGDIFEPYIQQLFETAFPGQVYRIPEDANEKRAVLLIWFPDMVVLVEVKGEHFRACSHASFLSIEERLAELKEKGLRKAIRQLASTVQAIRRGDIRAPSMPPYDWTVKRIIPVIVTEEQMPWVYGCWDAFYGPLCTGLEKLKPMGPISELRLLTVTEVEHLPGVELGHDFATMLARWAADRNWMEFTWGAFLTAQGISLQSHFMSARFVETIKLLAQRLGIDEAQLVWADTADEQQE